MMEHIEILYFLPETGQIPWTSQLLSSNFIMSVSIVVCPCVMTFGGDIHGVIVSDCRYCFDNLYSFLLQNG